MSVLEALGGLNYLAIVVGAIAALVIGFAWYLPPIMGRRWAQGISAYSGVAEKDLLQPANPLQPLGLWAVAFLLNALVLAVISRGLGAASVADALVLGFLAWLGFSATFSVWPVAFARQPSSIWFVNNGANLLMQLVIALIVTLWR